MRLPVYRRNLNNLNSRIHRIQRIINIPNMRTPKRSLIRRHSRQPHDAGIRIHYLYERKIIPSCFQQADFDAI